MVSLILVRFWIAASHLLHWDLALSSPDLPCSGMPSPSFPSSKIQSSNGHGAMIKSTGMVPCPRKMDLLPPLLPRTVSVSLRNPSVRCQWLMTTVLAETAESDEKLESYAYQRSRSRFSSWPWYRGRPARGSLSPWSGYASSRNSQKTVLSYNGLLSYSRVGTKPLEFSLRRDSDLASIYWYGMFFSSRTVHTRWTVWGNSDNSILY